MRLAQIWKRTRPTYPPGASQMKQLLRVVALPILLLAAPVALYAQAGATHFNVAAGAAIPTGDFGNAAGVGYQVAVGFGMLQRGSPFGFRFEGMLSDFGLNNSSQSERV